MGDIKDDKIFGKVDAMIALVPKIKESWKEEDRIWNEKRVYHYPKSMAILNEFDILADEMGKLQAPHDAPFMLKREMTTYRKVCQQFSKYYRAFLKDRGDRSYADIPRDKGALVLYGFIIKLAVKKFWMIHFGPHHRTIKYFILMDKKARKIMDIMTADVSNAINKVVEYYKEEKD